MKNRRKTVWLLVLLASILTIGVAASLMMPHGLPHPDIASRHELLQWVVDRDLAKESPETCLTLVRRLEGEFSATGVDWASLDGQLTDAQREQLWKNIPLLFRPWLGEKAAIYARLSNAERSRFMDSVMKMLATWQGADQLQVKKADKHTAKESHDLTAMLINQIEAYKRDAEPSERDRIDQFFLAIQARALMMM